ncbi:surfeit locus protein 6 containing protein, partial [Wuchereria bancrofti]
LPSDEAAVPIKRPKLGTESKVGEMEKKDDKLIFSKFDFIVRDEKQRKAKKDKRDKFTGKDYKRLLVKAEKREERLEKVRSKNPEKALKIEKNIQWKKALSRAEGQKVKDNAELLKKSLKRKEKIKESRRRKWANRVEHTLQMQARKQEKRSANIQARKDIVKKEKCKKLERREEYCDSYFIRLLVMKSAFAYLLLILTINKVACYDTFIPDFNKLKDDILQAKRVNLRRFKRASNDYRGYSESHFYGIQTKLNNQFAEFIMQAVTFAANVQRNRAFYYDTAKICKFLRHRIM